MQKFFDTHRLSMQVGAKRARTCVQLCVSVYSNWASTFGGWVLFKKNTALNATSSITINFSSWNAQRNGWRQEETWEEEKEVKILPLFPPFKSGFSAGRRGGRGERTYPHIWLSHLFLAAGGKRRRRRRREEEKKKLLELGAFKWVFSPFFRVLCSATDFFKAQDFPPLFFCFNLY